MGILGLEILIRFVDNRNKCHEENKRYKDRVRMVSLFEPREKDCAVGESVKLHE